MAYQQPSSSLALLHSSVQAAFDGWLYNASPASNGVAFYTHTAFLLLPHPRSHRLLRGWFA